jgi:hypothetical protein
MYNTVIRNLGAAFTATTNRDNAAMQPACESLRGAVEAFQAYRPAPDPELETHLAAALAQLARGATDCVAGVTTNSGALISTATEEFKTASSELRQSAARVKTINGN